MDKEKQEWLKEVGIFKLDKPVANEKEPHKPFVYCKIFPVPPGTEKMFYGEDYIENTSLEELKARHERFHGEDTSESCQ